MLDDLPVLEAAHVNHGDLERFARWEISHEPPSTVRAAPGHPRPDLISVVNHGFGGKAEGGKGAAKIADGSLEPLEGWV